MRVSSSEYLGAVRKCPFISPASKFRLCWDLLVIALSLLYFLLFSFYLGFSLPVSCAYG